VPSQVGSGPELMTIGEVARRAQVPTSTIRYYERRRLLDADARQYGQRRYRPQTLRRLIFIGMMRDIGLTLDEVHAILHAATADEWKPIRPSRHRLQHHGRRDRPQAGQPGLVKGPWWHAVAGPS